MLSDTHGFIHQMIVEHLADSDVVIHAGDIGSSQVLRTLKTITKHDYAVRGNNDTFDKWGNRDVKTLNALPDSVQLDLKTFRICVNHGHMFNPAYLRHQCLRKAFTSANLVVYGHSHRLIIDQAQSPCIVNPGSAGKTRTFGGASCLLIAFEKNDFSVVAFRVQN